MHRRQDIQFRLVIGQGSDDMTADDIGNLRDGGGYKGVHFFKLHAADDAYNIEGGGDGETVNDLSLEVADNANGDIHFIISFEVLGGSVGDLRDVEHQIEDVACGIEK